MAEPSPATILVVDDTIESLRFVTAALEAAGMTVLVASDGAAALQSLAVVRPDLIVMDAMMPVMDGFEATRRLKADPVNASLPVIFMTGLSETEHVVAGLNAGAVDYVTKPVVIDELLAHISVHLGNARDSRRSAAALDDSGRSLIAITAGGALAWATPGARTLLARHFAEPAALADLGTAALRLTEGEERGTLSLPVAGGRIDVSLVAQSAAAEWLFRIAEVAAGAEARQLAARFGLTEREAEVLLWISHGKANREISEILGISLPQPSGADDTTVTPEQYNDNFYRVKDANFGQTYATRNYLLLQLNETLKGTAIFAYQQTKTDGRQSNGAFQFNTGKYEAPWRYLEPNDRQVWVYSFELEADFGFATLISSTSYTLQRISGTTDNTDLLLDLNYSYEAFPAFSSYANNQTRNTQFTQELRLVSNGDGPLKYTAGFFYNDINNQGARQEYTPGFAAFISSPRIDDLEYISFFDNTNEETAIFGELTWNITDKWQITGGGRYYSYNATAEGGTDLPLFGGGLVRTPYPLIQFDPSRIGSGESSSDGFVYKANTSYKFREGLLAYFTYSTGYRIGGPNTVAPCILSLQPGQNVCALEDELFYGPDKTYNAELGIRATFFDNRVTINADIFNIDWSGLQVGSQTVNGAVGITTNAGAARSRGFEMTASWAVLDGLTLSGSYAYNDAKLTEDAPGLITVDNEKFDAFAGDRLPGSTRHQGSILANYQMDLGDDTGLMLNWAATYRGDVYTKTGLRGYGEVIPGYWLNRGAVTITKGGYEFSVFANNIFNTYAVTAVGNDFSKIGVRNPDYGISRRFYSYAVVPPRQVGFEARVRF